MAIFELDERVKFYLNSMVIFIIGLFLMIFINNITLKKINNEYIRQNIAIVGSISELGEEHLNKVIPIITKGDLSSFDKGSKILKKYSYDLDLNIEKNYLVKDGIKNSYIMIAIIYSFIFATIFIYLKTKIHKIQKYIRFLTKKAEYIVEGTEVKYDKEKYKIEILEDLDIQFNLMDARIKKSIADLKKEKINLKNIINDITHQFKTPLAAMSMYNDILKKHRKMSKEDIDYFVEMTTQQLERMNWLTKTLLKYARLEGDVVEYKKEKQSINKTIKNSMDTLKSKALEKNIELLSEYNEEITILHDRKWLEEAFINIIKNAIEHTKCNGEIKITIKESEVYVKVEIEDNGEGILEKDINKIFKRFHKGSNSTNPQSIGIGLALSKSIIESNGGDIKVKSKVGQGSNFIITFMK